MSRKNSAADERRAFRVISNKEQRTYRVAPHPYVYARSGVQRCKAPNMRQFDASTVATIRAVGPEVHRSQAQKLSGWPIHWPVKVDEVVIKAAAEVAETATSTAEREGQGWTVK